MAIMNYETPDIKKIEFEDNLFVTTELDRYDESPYVREYIESRGGIIKNSVTKGTNYLIYQDGAEETTKYKKALELVQEKGLEINILPLSMFKFLCKGKKIVEFGSYPFEADGTKQPIKWAVLKQEGNKALLLSAYGLDAKPYDKEGGETWENCTLRKWLNEDFYNIAFSDEEKKRIHLTAVRNAYKPTYGKPGNDTEDRIFLLSIEEAKRYLTKIGRETRPTPYAVKQGAFESLSGITEWWLRSPGRNTGFTARVNHGGGVDDFGSYVDLRNDAVCPALWIDLESEI